MFDRAGNLDPEFSKAACAMSGLSFIVRCATYYILLAGVSLLGRKHLEVKIPFAASCSLVISAACHVSTGATMGRCKGAIVWHGDALFAFF
jgi:hypothetical protein